MRERICVALDVEMEEAMKMVTKLEGVLNWVKIGPALLTDPDGVSLLNYAKHRGFKVFADYKFKDIPSVVGKAVKNLVGVADLVTVHIDGGEEMLKAAKKAAAGNIKIVGVTLLTSLNHRDLLQFGYPDGTATYVNRMVEVALDSGIDGIVCSAREVSSVKLRASHLFCVTPGLKAGVNECDYVPEQKRDADPRWAHQQGSDLLVMGRDIYTAEDVVKRVSEIEKWCLGE